MSYVKFYFVHACSAYGQCNVFIISQHSSKWTSDSEIRSAVDREEHKAGYKFCILNKTFNIRFKSIQQYMHIVHIKITLHIQVLVYCKKRSHPIDYGPTQNLCTPLYTAKTIDDTYRNLLILHGWLNVQFE